MVLFVLLVNVLYVYLTINQTVGGFTSERTKEYNN